MASSSQSSVAPSKYNKNYTVPYTVISAERARDSIKLQLRHFDDDEHMQEIMRKKRKEIKLQDVQHLCFSFQNIYKISNLEGFDSLKILQLDNNNISKIENVGHLVNLERLDLSFNNLRKIEGLQGLKNLKVLSLFNNKISKIENMEGLDSLTSFSIAKNNITDTNDIVYLRQFKHLGSLTVFDNPVCEERNFRYLVLAYLACLKYFDYRQVSAEERHQAKEYFHQEIIKLQDLNEREEKAKLDEEKAQALAKDLDSANLKGVDSLFEDMFKNDPEDANRRHFDYVLLDMFEKFKTDFMEHVESFKKNMKQRLDEKQKVNRDLEEKKNLSIEHTIEVSKKKIKDFEKNMKHTLERHEGQGLSNKIELLEKERKKLANDLIEIEVNQADTFNEIIDQFKTSYKELDASEMISSFFREIRELEGKFQEQVKRTLEQEAEEFRSDTEKKFEKKVGKAHMEKVKPFLEDKDQMQILITRSQESHAESIGQKEEELLNTERRRMQHMLEKVSMDEHNRNRARISEIWMFVDRAREDLEHAREDDDDNS